MILIVDERWGKCNQCGVEALVGDGLCVDCWDGKPSKPTVKKEIPKKFADKVLRQKLGKISTPQRADTVVVSAYGVLCKYCGSSSVVKYGHGSRLKAQYWFCRYCGHKFTINGALPGMQYQESIVRAARQMYRDGYSYSEIRRDLYDKYKVNVGSNSTLFGWFRNIPLVSKDVHCRKVQDKLVQRLMASLGIGTVYSARAILDVCGYSPQTKIEHTQLFKQGLISQVVGGWQVTESLMVCYN